MKCCQHLFAQLMLTAIHITWMKFLLYFPNLHHPVIALSFLVDLEQEIDVSFRYHQGGTSSLFYDLHENMVFVVRGSLIFVYTEFPPGCPSNSAIVIINSKSLPKNVKNGDSYWLEPQKR